MSDDAGVDPEDRHRRPVCSYEGSTYQSRFWDSGQRAYEDGSEAVALAALLPPGGARLLEVGAGAGRNTARYTGFEQVVLLDYSRSQLEQARERLGPSERYTYVAADVYRLPFVAGAFDGATMIRVAHHLVEPAAALAGLHRVLAPGAVLILEFANKRNLKAIARWALRRQQWSPFDRQPAEILELNYDFHPGAMLEDVAAVGFEVDELRSLSYLRLGAFKRALPTSALVTIDRWLQPTGRWVQLSPSVFVRARVAGDAPAELPTRVFCCPECAATDLADGGDHLACSGCGRHWPVVDGIHDFRQPR